MIVFENISWHVPVVKGKATCHLMTIDGEDKVGVARNGNEAEAIAFVRLHLDNGERASWASGITSKSVNQGGIWEHDWRL